MSSQIEVWYFIKDDILYRHTELDGYQAMRHGNRPHDEALMSVEEAKVKMPKQLKLALEEKYEFKKN